MRVPPPATETVAVSIALPRGRKPSAAQNRVPALAAEYGARRPVPWNRRQSIRTSHGGADAPVMCRCRSAATSFHESSRVEGDSRPNRPADSRESPAKFNLYAQRWPILLLFVDDQTGAIVPTNDCAALCALLATCVRSTVRASVAACGGASMKSCSAATSGDMVPNAVKWSGHQSTERGQFMKRNVLIGAVVAVAISAGLAWATPGSGFIGTVLQRSLIDGPIAIHTGPRDLNDILVQQSQLQPGGNSGWHSHPGPVIIAVKSGVVAFYSPGRRRRSSTDGTDAAQRATPWCTVQYFPAGSAYFVEPNEVHFIQNEGSVVYEDFATFVLPVGVPARTDEPSPGGNCPL